MDRKQSCEHGFAERQEPVLNGHCPICSGAEIERLAAEVEKLKAALGKKLDVRALQAIESERDSLAAENEQIGKQCDEALEACREMKTAYFLRLDDPRRPNAFAGAMAEIRRLAATNSIETSGEEKP